MQRKYTICCDQATRTPFLVDEWAQGLEQSELPESARYMTDLDPDGYTTVMVSVLPAFMDAMEEAGWALFAVSPALTDLLRELMPELAEIICV